MGRFEGKQLVKLASTTYRQGRCTIRRGDTAWVVFHKGRFVGERDTYVEAEELSHNETGRLNAQKDIDEGYEGGEFDALDLGLAKEDAADYDTLRAKAALAEYHERIT